MAEESKGTVLAAMAANLAIAVGKLFAGLLTGSAALLAEAGHSTADTVNQVFLLLGVNLSDTRPDERHPHGYGKEGFFWSFLAAIFIFVAGAAFSWFEGIRTLVADENHHRSGAELALAFGVLGGAALFESISFMIAVRGIVAGARRRGWSFSQYLRRSPDLTTKTVFWEDSAALTGLALAALGLGLSELAGDELWDGVASLAIGCVLAGVALMLGLQARNLLLGAAAPQETQDAIVDTIHSFPEVDAIVRLLTMQLGSRSVLVTGELEVHRNMTTDAIEGLIRRIDGRLEERVPEVRETFWELRRCPDESHVAEGAGPQGER
ncbi:MAG: cation diffusion facilitator family transporter [Dehalococcoidia bacterium]|nr:cation diffusion facilitator family transporter [Dehalococcoidia bacterium]